MNRFCDQIDAALNDLNIKNKDIEGYYQTIAKSENDKAVMKSKYDTTIKQMKSEIHDLKERERVLKEVLFTLKDYLKLIESSSRKSKKEISIEHIPLLI